MTQDSLSLLLTKIRNGYKYKNHYIIHDNTKITKTVVQLLYLHGLLKGYRVINTKLYIYLKFHDIRPVVTSITRISRPGFKKFATVSTLKNIQINHTHLAVLSTVHGIMSHTVAIQHNVGGEFLFIIS